MGTRLTRSEQAEQVRADVLAAARAEFLEAGYRGATLDRIASRAGYTKGAVYSRYASKADLFLALLEERIEARARQNRRLARAASGRDGLVALAQRWAAIQRDDLAWTLLVLEFRVHAARNPQLLERYAELHARTLDGIEDVLREVLRADEVPAGLALRDIAQAIFAAGNGATLEQAVDRKALPARVIARMALGLTASETDR